MPVKNHSKIMYKALLLIILIIIKELITLFNMRTKIKFDNFIEEFNYTLIFLSLYFVV